MLVLCSPCVSSADARGSLEKNYHGVIAIVTYDGEGNAVVRGSGFIVREDGVVVTNYHVISDVRDIRIKAGNKFLGVRGFLYVDKASDVVILKAGGNHLQAVNIGDDSKIEIGEKVYFEGSAGGPENTVSDGVLSGIKEVTPRRKVLEITAPIPSGGSGGAVFNHHGEVIGIATVLMRDGQSLNFVMPVAVIKGKIDSGMGKVISLQDVEREDYEKTADYWLYVGAAYGWVSMLQKEIEAYKEAVRINPDLWETQYNLGLAYYNAGMYQSAIGAYEEAVRINPDLWEAQYNLGLAYTDAGMDAEAIGPFKQAARINPGNEQAYLNLGGSYCRLRQYKDGVGAYKQAVRIKPDDEKAQAALGQAYYDSGMYKEAIEAYRQAISVKPDFEEAYYMLGSAYGRLNMYSDAIGVYKQAVRIRPDDDRAHFMLGIFYLLAGDKDLALEEHKILKGLDPAQAKTLFYLIYKEAD